MLSDGKKKRSSSSSSSLLSKASVTSGSAAVGRKEGGEKNAFSYFDLVFLSDVTGLTPWRASGIKHRKNEVYIDVIESVNMLVSAKGTLLRADVEGQVDIDSFRKFYFLLIFISDQNEGPVNWDA